METYFGASRRLLCPDRSSNQSKGSKPGFSGGTYLYGIFGTLFHLKRQGKTDTAPVKTDVFEYSRQGTEALNIDRGKIVVPRFFSVIHNHGHKNTSIFSNKQ
jgi:hypothetical protein